MPEDTPQATGVNTSNPPRKSKAFLAFLIIAIFLSSLYLGIAAHEKLTNLQLIQKFSDTTSAEYKDPDSVFYKHHWYKNDYARKAIIDGIEIEKDFPWTDYLNIAFAKCILYGVFGITGAIIFILTNLLFREVRYTNSEVILILLLGGLIACLFVLLLFDILAKQVPAIQGSPYPRYAASVICGLSSNSAYNLFRKKTL